MTQTETSNSQRWYWRLSWPLIGFTPGHGTAETREGAVAQIAACLLHSPHIVDNIEGRGMELVIQGPIPTQMHKGDSDG